MPAFDQQIAPSPEPIPRERASVLVVEHNKILVVRLRDPQSGFTALYLPGGKIEFGETPQYAAERECLEETGYRVRAEAQPKLVSRYLFTWDGKSWDTTTHFFYAQLEAPDTNPAPVNDSAYNLGWLWLPVEQHAQAFGFHKPIAAAVATLLEPNAVAPQQTQP